ncbi:MAG: FkbM family methyltransferase [Thermoleophilia bacterium]|nr:FkbM family methyltransferase [Thermoleophilia bacterium]
MHYYPIRFRLANSIYKKNFRLYRRLYFPYKKISDRKWIARIRETVRPGMTVLDIGANIGYYTMLFSSLVGKDGRVHAFEPEPLNFRHLESLAGSLPNVRLHPVAVAENTKKAYLYLSEEMNVDHQTYDIGEGRPRMEIDCVSIDEYLRGEAVDFIKMDIQGYEYYALRGMRDIIAKSGRVTLMGELWTYGTKRAGVDPSEYLRLLDELGFKLEFLDDPPPDDETIREKTGDRMFFTTYWATR